MNLVNGLAKFSKTRLRLVAKSSLWLGVFLFIKVAIEDLVNGMVAGLWSLDMRERIVREKLGSGLVISSMFLHLQKPSSRNQQKRQGTKVPKLTEHGNYQSQYFTRAVSRIYPWFPKKCMLTMYYVITMLLVIIFNRNAHTRDNRLWSVNSVLFAPSSGNEVLTDRSTSDEGLEAKFSFLIKKTF